MLLAVVLLYVGAVLAVNGIWLVGQAQAASAQSRLAAVRTGAGSPGNPSSAQTAVVEAETGEELGGEQVVQVARAERSPLFIQNREIAVLNIFTGFIGVVAAVTLLVQGNRNADLLSVRAGGYILLFAFTYLWVAANQFINAGGKAFGWYCLFVAGTAIPAGIYVLQAANGNTALTWLGIDWFAWALLWGMFWALLSLNLPIARIVGWLAIIEGVGTSWALAIAVLEGKLSFA
jgi:hypothetical protein